MHEIRYALRQIRKNPGFAIIAISTLALGIGANTAIFSVVNAVLLRPLPYPQSDRLVLLRERLTGPSGFESGSVSYLNYLDWCAAQHSFTDIGLVRRESANLSGSENGASPDRVSVARVTANYLSILGLRPHLGHDFTEKDDVPGAAKVVLISERLWRNRFAGLPLALGQRLNVDGVSHEIIGVVPDEVRLPRNAAVFLPLADLRAEHDLLSRGNHESFSGVARLKPGVTLKQATEDLDTIAADLARRYPDSNSRREVSAKFLLEYSVGQYRQLLYLLLAAVGCVLLIACANVANLQLARGIARRKELAVRVALGASRAQLARQVLVETGIIALIGGACAGLIALWRLDTIRALSPAHAARFDETAIDPSVLLFTGAIVIIATFLVGLWPALRISNNAMMANDLHDNGARGSDGAERQRARSILVVTQVSLAVVLLAAAGLTLRSFWRAEEVPLGFNAHGILSMTIALPTSRYDSADKIRRFYDQLIEKVAALPGVDSAAVCNNAPFDAEEWDSSFHITGTPPDPVGQEPISEMSIVSPNFVRVLGLPILRGRNFDANDRAGRPLVALIDELAAQRFFPGQNPIGKQIDDPVTIGDPGQTGPPVTIIGIVPHTRNNAPGDQIDVRNLTQMYFCAAQFPKNQQDVLLRVRPGYNPQAIVAPIKQQIAALDPDQAISDVATMEKNIAESLASRRLTMSLLTVFAALALFLASIGLYGVMALSVTQRTRELGIRLALGAHRGDVFRLVLGQGMILVGIGLLLGLIVAAGTGRGLASILYNITVWDPPALLGSVITLALVALVACWLPALRATRVDPIIALRTE